MSAALLVDIMRAPREASSLPPDAWNGVIAAARAEQMLGNLAARLDGVDVPPAVAMILADALAETDAGRRRALWEADRARAALAPLGIAPLLLKGTAYAAAGLPAAAGRSIGDLDILVPRDRLDAAEAALLAHGWEWVKPDPYDDAYYRQWMHELPPLIHRERDRMIDVHHTILPLTARQRPDAAALIAGGQHVGNGLFVLSPEAMLVHAAAHLFADGDLSGGLRNLWDINQLCRDFAAKDEDFFLSLYEQAARHGLSDAVMRALRLASRIYDMPCDDIRLVPSWSDRFFVRRMTARDGWGRGTRPFTRLAFYIRSHWLRMPPAMLARHLFTKWRKRRSG